jgi:G3E family GTPase
MQVTLGLADAATIFLRGVFEAGRSLPGLGGWLLAGKPMAQLSGNPSGGAHRGPRPTTHVIRTEQAVDMAGLGVFLNRVTNSMREQLLRIKGVANVKSRPRHITSQGPLVVHAVREKFYPLQWLDAWPDADRSTRLVFIGRELDGAGLDRLFEQLCL